MQTRLILDPFPSIYINNVNIMHALLQERGLQFFYKSTDVMCWGGRFRW